MTESRKQLLLGAGYPLRGGVSKETSYRKKLHVYGGPQVWEALTTLDINTDADPDLWCDLNMNTWSAMARGEHGFREMQSDYWDEIHAYEVLEHLGSLGDAHAFLSQFSEIWRLLKPGGHLLATVPSKRSGFFWGDPSHRRAIVEESLIFLDQAEYVRQCDGPNPTGMSDFRSFYKADFKCVDRSDNGSTFAFILQAVKPSRWKSRT